MKTSSKVVNEFLIDHQDLIYQLKLVRNTSIPLKIRSKDLEKICLRLIQIGQFQENVLNNYMRGRVEDDFQVLVLFTVNNHEKIILCINELIKVHFLPRMWCQHVENLSMLVAGHFNLIEKQVFECLKFYIGSELDEVLLKKYFNEYQLKNHKLCTKNVLSSEFSTHKGRAI